MLYRVVSQIGKTGVPRGFVLADKMRAQGINIMAASGSARFRLAGKHIAIEDSLQRTPTIIVDGTGNTLDNLLDSLLRLPAEFRNNRQ